VEKVPGTGTTFFKAPILQVFLKVHVKLMLFRRLLWDCKLNIL